MRNSLRIVVCTLLVTLFGCASAPQLDSYPRRQIDRPYTLPKGVASWQPTLGFSNTSEQGGVSNFTVGFDPLVWQQSLSDDWNLIWWPLPLILLHQFEKTDSNRIGMSVGVKGFEYSSSNGFRLSTNVQIQERHYFGQKLALDFMPSFTENTAFQSGQTSTWSADLGIAPLYQLTETLAVQPGFTLSWTNGQSPNQSYYTDNDLLPPNTTQLTLPLWITVDWSVSRKWDLNATYSYHEIGYTNGFTNHVGNLAAVYYW